MNRGQCTVNVKAFQPSKSWDGWISPRLHPNIITKYFLLMSCFLPLHHVSFVVSLPGGDRLDLVISDSATLTYDDLLGFSYQVAKGMEFLASKNVRCEAQHNRPFRNKSVAMKTDRSAHKTDENTEAKQPTDR